MKSLPVMAAMFALLWQPPMQEPSSAIYLNGEPVALAMVPAAGKEKSATFGPWKLGLKVVESKPHDNRLNLYIVVPGDDFQSDNEAFSLYDHNRVINMVPKEHGPAEFDVYWAVALEPHLNRDFHSETELLAAAQRHFVPGDLFDVKDAPGAAFLKEMLHIDTVDGLKPYRRQKDGALPTIVIIPAGFAVRGSVQP